MQDFLFVRSFVRMAGTLLSCAPDEHLELLTGGIASLRDELIWFQDVAHERGLQLDASAKLVSSI